MQLAKEQKAIFVCSNPPAMQAKAQAYGIEGLSFISYIDFIHNYDPDIQLYVVDELEEFVNTIFTSGPQLIGYSLSIE